MSGVRCAAGLAGAVLAGCAAWQPAPPAPVLAPVAVPAHWSAAAGPEFAAVANVPAPAGGAVVAGGGGPPPVAWWQQFRDPRLDRLIGQALRANPSLEGSRAALRQARAVRDQAAAALAPAVTGNAALQRDATDGVRSGSGAGTVAGSWDPDWSGARRAAERAAQAAAEAAAWTLEDAQAALAAETAQDYIALRGAQLRLAIARANLANQEDTAQITAWRTQAGLLTALENEQARAAREQAAAQVPLLDTQIAQRLHALAIRCGVAPGTLESALADAAPVPEPPAALALAIPAEVLRARPDVRAAELRMLAASARLVQADAERKPAFHLQGSLSVRGFEPGGAGASSLLRSLLGSVTGNALDGGAAAAGLRGQGAALEQAQDSYRAVLLQALAEVEDSLAAIAAGRTRLQRLAAAVEAASNAALLARDRYASGLTDFQTVLETQRNLYARQDDEAATRIALAADHVRLYRALGGARIPGAPAQPAVPVAQSGVPVAQSGVPAAQFAVPVAQSGVPAAQFAVLAAQPADPAAQAADLAAQALVPLVP